MITHGSSSVLAKVIVCPLRYEDLVPIDTLQSQVSEVTYQPRGSLLELNWRSRNPGIHYFKQIFIHIYSFVASSYFL